GLDISLDALRLAWKANGVPAVCATLSSPPFAPGSCSAVTMFHVLEHLYDPHSYLEEARGLLKPGGRLIVQVPNAACWQFLFLGRKWSGLDVPRHLWSFRPRDLDALLGRNGFEVVRRKHFSLRDNPAGLATSLAPSLERAVSDFAAALPQGARVLDAGAGEGKYAGFFRAHRYCGLDFALGDAAWDYSDLDVVADLLALPFHDECFDACLNVVTLEHV